ncbi:hypothetical protein ACFPYN_09530 [Paenisporosarcina macmurdoensis]|uniref:MotA/TolQ/ExbB proton channel domain-containing protein n=1 Tax=Paenisporosarcina macmurdoensis TaxID=212659 RepID=A0ABW1L7D9_9BACL
MKNFLITIIGALIFPFFMVLMMYLVNPVNEFMYAFGIITGAPLVLVFGLIAVKTTKWIVEKNKIENLMKKKSIKMISLFTSGAFGGLFFTFFYGWISGVDMWRVLDTFVIIGCVSYGFSASLIWLGVEKVISFIPKKTRNY